MMEHVLMVGGMITMLILGGTCGYYLTNLFPHRTNIKSRGTLEYDLEDFDSKMSHYRAVKSLDMAHVLFEIQCNLKKKCNWICDGWKTDGDKYDGVQVVFEQIQELFDERNINIDELIR